MPGRGVMRAKQKRAGSLGQGSRFYVLRSGQSAIKVAGAQGYGKTNPSIGSMRSLGIMKQNRNAGGNNVCIINNQALNSNCDCHGPKAYCPNCSGRQPLGTITGGSTYSSTTGFTLLTH